MQDNDKLENSGKSREFGHVHGVIDPAIISTERGIWAIKWSFYVLLPAAIFQLIIVLFSGSVSLFADSIHNFGDVATAIPLWIAFIFALKDPNKTFTYGYGKFEDLAGVAIVIIILISAIFSGYESITRFFHPQMLENLWAIALAAIVGFLGNEIVSIFRIRVGKEISSTSLIADGYHARADGFTSLAVLIGVIGAYLGFPLADPIIGIIITILLFRIVWQSGKSVFTRLLDGVDPEVVDNIRDALTHVPEVQNVTEVRVRWLGHRLETEINLSVDPKLSVEEAHKIAKKAQKHLLYHLKYLSYTTIHIDPTDASGEAYHK
jgi:cation diffusion facilitator family transporter